MNSFYGWFLPPRFQIDLKPSEFFNDEKNTSIHLTLESEINWKDPKFSFAQSLFNELKPKLFYPLNKNGKNYLFIVPKNEPKKLSFQSPGKSHVASHVGALFSAQLITAISTNNQFSEGKNIAVTLSEGLKKIIEGEENEFFLGILQRSVTCKIKKVEPKNKSQIISLIFNEDSFTKNSLIKSQAVSDAMCITRSLINMPPNELNPESYEKILHSLVKAKNESNTIKVETFDYEKLTNEGCTLICAVGQGSQYKPRIIKLSYYPNSINSKLKHVTLVGKGITFDSGGYDIKSSSGMRIMKKDMGGSAAALGIFFACSSLNLPVRLTCYLAIAENMVAGNAMRPGDIYKTRNGFHVEIENTDAEGRLVLADAISLACDEKPDWLIDLATLTGAARVSLGPMIDSLYGNNKSTSDLLYNTSIENGDWVWQMPLLAEYENYLDSSVGDFMNASSASFAGSITAALFIEKFITIEKWNHIDTYMWCDKPNYLWQEGATPTGKCVRLVTKAIEKFILKEDNIF